MKTPESICSSAPSGPRSSNIEIYTPQIFESVAEGNLHCFCLLRLVELEPDQKDFVILFVNQKLVDLLQLDREQIVGQRLSQIYPFSDNWTQCNRYFEALQGRESITEEFPLEIFGGTRWYRHEIVPLDDHQISITAEDITSRRRLQKQLVRKAYFDDLTGLKNRTALVQFLSRVPERNTRVFLVLFDIDNFQNINQCFGLIKADQLIKSVALSLSELNAGSCYRIAADTFAMVLVRQFAETALGDICVAKWAQEISGSYQQQDGQLIECAFSAGYATASSSEVEDCTVLLSQAEIALATAKQKTVPRVVRYFGPIMKAHQQRLRIGSSIVDALASEEFVAYYQPQYDLRYNRPVGCEALCRWNSKKLGQVSPDIFIGIAEQMNLLAQLDLQLLSNVVDFSRQLPLSQNNISLAVNASPSSIQKTDYLDQLIELYRGLPVWCSLEVELTENVLISDDQSLRQGMIRLLNAGISMTLDDFGSGYSNLIYLSSYPFEKLKLDRCLIQDLENNSRNALLISATIDLAHRLGLKVVAEGIETEYQCNWLRDVGCDLGQGFYFSKPLSPKDSFVFFECLKKGQKSKAQNNAINHKRH